MGGTLETFPERFEVPPLGVEGEYWRRRTSVELWKW